MKTLIVSKLNRKFSAKTIIMKSYGRKVDAKVQYVPETKKVSKVVVVFSRSRRRGKLSFSCFQVDKDSEFIRNSIESWGINV